MRDLLGKVEESVVKNPQPCGFQDFRSSFFDIFCLFVGSGKRFSVQEISEASGLPKDTVENWSQKLSAPNFDNLMTLCRVLPFEFKSRFIAMLGGSDIVREIKTDLAEDLEYLASKYRGLI